MISVSKLSLAAAFALGFVVLTAAGSTGAGAEAVSLDKSFQASDPTEREVAALLDELKRHKGLIAESEAIVKYYKEYTENYKSFIGNTQSLQEICNNRRLRYESDKKTNPDFAGTNLGPLNRCEADMAKYKRAIADLDQRFRAIKTGLQNILSDAESRRKLSSEVEVEIAAKNSLRGLVTGVEKLSKDSNDYKKQSNTHYGY